MKKVISILMVLAMTLVLFAGCGSEPAGPGKENEQLHVAMIFTQSLGDAGPMDSMNTNLKKAEEDFNIKVSTFEALQPSQYEEALRSFARDGADFIATAMPGMVEPLKLVAAEFPEVKFCILFPLEEIDMPNVTVVDFATWEMFYLAGIIGGSMTETGVIGHVVGAEQSSIVADDNAFFEGAKLVNENVKVFMSSTNTFDDPAKGKEAALNPIGQGCDIIFTNAAKTGLGVIEAGKEKGIYVIADSSPHSDLAPETILFDTNCAYGPSLYAQIRLLAEGNFQAGLHFADLKEGGVELLLNPYIRDKMTTEQQEKYDAALQMVEEMRAKIISGEVVVERNIEKR